MRTLIEMAREAGGYPAAATDRALLLFSESHLERFAALVRADEREACAKEFDRRAVYVDGSPSSGWYEPEEPARIIRARGNS